MIEVFQHLGRRGRALSLARRLLCSGPTESLELTEPVARFGVVLLEFQCAAEVVLGLLVVAALLVGQGEVVSLRRQLVLVGRRFELEFLSSDSARRFARAGQGRHCHLLAHNGFPQLAIGEVGRHVVCRLRLLAGMVLHVLLDCFLHFFAVGVKEHLVNGAGPFFDARPELDATGSRSRRRHLLFHLECLGQLLGLGPRLAESHLPRHFRLQLGACNDP
ncbi:MAG: hypothetical protein ACYS8L_11165, partial [Planctomycetota bacterium]